MRKGDRIYFKDEFVEKYTNLFNEGFLDSEIADKLFVSFMTVSHYKRQYGIKTHRRRRNEWGVTENHFRIAKENGISRHNVLQRMRAGYSVQQAITKPSQYRSKKKLDKTIELSTN